MAIHECKLCDAFVVLVFCTLLSCSNASSSDICDKKDNADDCTALKAIGTSFNYRKWTDKNAEKWMTSSSVCDWNGVECSKGRVKEINLAKFGIDGYIPSEIGLLSELVEIKISGSRPASYHGCAENNLHNSTIPDSFWNLTKLQEIDFEYTCLGGPISDKLGDLTQLTSIQFHGNYLNGTIPTTVGKLENLQTFKFGRNPLTGPFPNVSTCHQLIQLSANFCALTGPVPDIFENFPNLNIAYFDGNGFSGSLPPSLGKLKNLWSFSFNINNFTGKVPDTYCTAPKLTDCRIGSDTNLAEYQANYPWLQPVVGNLFDCPLPVCATDNNVCDKTSPCGGNGAWKPGTTGPCSPVKCK